MSFLHITYIEMEAGKYECGCLKRLGNSEISRPVTAQSIEMSSRHVQVWLYTDIRPQCDKGGLAFICTLRNG